ncbi:MAG: acetyl-CoA carboxylase biotin carboxyl carrier protein subunit [Deltaproteobacteria bacterium]|nr:acetyl-CoA carboxylase biotin carboxyl carrier protein subunit [Deltaproteobacteria bacterium]
MVFDAYFGERPQKVKIEEDVRNGGGGYLITIDDGAPFHVDAIDKLAGGYSLLYKGKSYEFDIESKDHLYNVLSRGNLYCVELIHQKSTLARLKEFGEKKIISRMPGKIIKVLAKVGDTVTKGQGLIIMEAMKMENELKAPSSGKVKDIKVKEGKTVDAGVDLLLIE